MDNEKWWQALIDWLTPTWIFELRLRRSEVRVLIAGNDALREALQWCSGSDDFGVGGKARVGWVKICAPLLGVEIDPGELNDG